MVIQGLQLKNRSPENFAICFLLDNIIVHLIGNQARSNLVINFF